MNTNWKIYALLFLGLGSMLSANIFYVFPRIKNSVHQAAADSTWPAAAGQYLNFIDMELLELSALLAILAIALMLISVLLANTFLKPVNSFINRVSSKFLPGGKGSLEGVSSCIETVCNNIFVLDNVPIGIMVVDPGGTITYFNREAGEIAELVPSSVIGAPMMQYFPNNYYNYTMEVINSGREYLGLRNIIKVGGFFKELLFSISPIRSHDSITGAVAVFQDVTPQRKMIEVRAAYALARDLATQKDLGGAFQVIARSAAEMVEIEFSAVFLADHEGRLLLRSAHGIPSEAVESYNAGPLRVDSPEIKDLYQSRVPLLHGDVANRANLQSLLIIPGISSFYSFPVIYEDQLIGFLNLYSREKDRLSKDMVYLIQSLSGQLNTAIANFYELQKMRNLASVDGLTGLFNKKYFTESIGALIPETVSSGGSISLAMIDIDHFKQVNDRFGHPAGDQVLKDVAALISRFVRGTDLVCRYGGEEFSIIMSGTSKNVALEVAERIRTAVENTNFPGREGEPVKITVSCGVASFPRDASTAEDLIRHSDTALYTSKRSGRNRSTGYHQEQKMGF